MHVRIKAKWFDGWDWYVGVARGTLTEEECRKWMEPGFLNLKMGSAGKVDEYWNRGAAGLDLRPVESPPSIFPSRQGWTYFLLNQEHPTFRFVQQEKSLAVRFSEKYIRNLSELQGNRNLEVEVQGKRVTLQFALFALKRSGR
jgi:type VI secretion system protein ImpJ